MTLPPIDGNPFIKPKAKSTDRHRRETAFKVALDVSKICGRRLSVTTIRRMEYVVDFGSPEIKEALDKEVISISKAYSIVKAERFRIALKMLRSRRQSVDVRSSLSVG